MIQKDIMQRAIEKQRHITGNETVNSQTWQEFEEAANKKKIFLFGVGASADFFLEIDKNICLEGVIDNDVRKQGLSLDVFSEEAKETQNSSLCVSSIELLQKYDAEEIVVLITSINYYEQIIDELEKIGISNYYVLLIMEANRRKHSFSDAKEIKAISREEYTSVCCEKEIEWNKIIFYAFGGYADHGKYITEALLRIRKDLDIVWFVNDMTIEVPEGVRKVFTANWKRYIYEMETAGIWIFNMVVPSYIIKRPKQIYIQTKHWASITLKKFYLDSATIQNAPERVRNWRYNSKIIDYMITGSDFDTKSSRRGFDFRKEVWQIGSPRSDALFCREKCKKKVYDYYHINSQVRTLIYAPTYRFDQSDNQYLHESRGIDLDFEGVRRVLEKHFGGIWIIFLRLHPSVSKESKKIEKPDFVVDVSTYVDSEELVAACDIMISDYSSIMFEPAFVRKPVFLFATDKNDYIDKEYDLLIDYDTLPFPIAESNVELLQKMGQFNQDEYEKNLDAFMEQYGVHEDGHASERAAGLIANLIKNKGK